MKKTLLTLALLVGVSNSQATQFYDLDLITAKNGQIEVNERARDLAAKELADLQQESVIQTGITYADLDEFGESLLQNVIMRARDRLLRLNNRFNNDKGVTQERLDNNFYEYRLWNIVESKWESVIVYNPSDRRPQGAGYAHSDDVRHYNDTVAVMQSGLLLKEIAKNGAHFSFFTDNQNTALTVYAKDKQNGLFSKLNRIEYLKEYLAGFEQAASLRKQYYQERLQDAEYYIDDGYLMPRVP